MQPVVSLYETASRRRHDRLDLTPHQLEAWLVEESRTACRILNLSYSGMCLQAEDLFETGCDYRFVLDLASLLGAEVEVTARVVWKKSMGAGLCYLGAEFARSSAPWLGPDEEGEFGGL